MNESSYKCGSLCTFMSKWLRNSQRSWKGALFQQGSVLQRLNPEQSRPLGKAVGLLPELESGKLMMDVKKRRTVRFVSRPGTFMHLSIDTVLPADSVEFCPHPDASNIFVCGTYKLHDEKNSQPSDSIVSPPSGSATQTQTRTGQCLVYEVDSDSDLDVGVCV